ncbi:protein GRIM REAPER [Mangifera indica]|uniref:protein GRIM REAPER n=1 Tax=Mangifera indica TaxID=29780 RepID=UPI001CF9E952|nr:protein GRIM REAPER [Mangifera indica]
MAATTSTLLYLTLSLLLFLQFHIVFTFPFDVDADADDNEVYVLDNPVPNFRSRSRMLTQGSNVIKKGTHCDPEHKNICDGVSANKGTSLLYCCKTHCRNILSDMNNCGRCGVKCKFGERCCNGRCTSVVYNDNHCGKCNRKCPFGVKCEFGSCGYA